MSLTSCALASPPAAVRDLEDADRDAIERAIDHYTERLRSRMQKPWYKHLHRCTVVSALYSGEVRSKIIAGTYLLAYQVYRPWFGEVVVVDECLTLKVFDGPGVLSDCTGYLEALAGSLVGPSIVQVGTLLTAQDNALATRYERLGYHRALIGLTKDVP